MSIHHPKHDPSQDEEHPATAGDELLHEAEEAETSVAGFVRLYEQRFSMGSGGGL
ncbi:hypothetical protein [Streptomyces atroolivaceus]|uniref:hypothetical protein n=1 Tax=Streptomyces atroolivaceus TaxID=66869 RepID=UPI00341DF9B1